MPSAPYSPILDTAVYIGLVRLSTATVVSRSDRWNKTTLPIEQGASITNHRKRQPTTLTIAGVETGQIMLAGPVGPSRLSSPADVRRQLELLAETGTIFTVKWLDRLWPNMSIDGIDDDAPAGELRDDVWRYSIALSTTRIASSTTTPAGAVDPSISDLTAVASDGGPQAGTAVGPELAGEVTGVLGGGV